MTVFVFWISVLAITGGLIIAFAEDLAKGPFSAMGVTLSGGLLLSAVALLGVNPLGLAAVMLLTLVGVLRLGILEILRRRNASTSEEGEALPEVEVRKVVRVEKPLPPFKEKEEEVYW